MDTENNDSLCEGEDDTELTQHAISDILSPERPCFREDPVGTDLSPEYGQQRHIPGQEDDHSHSGSNLSQGLLDLSHETLEESSTDLHQVALSTASGNSSFPEVLQQHPVRTEELVQFGSGHQGDMRTRSGQADGDDGHENQAHMLSQHALSKSNVEVEASTLSQFSLSSGSSTRSAQGLSQHHISDIPPKISSEMSLSQHQISDMSQVQERAKSSSPDSIAMYSTRPGTVIEKIHSNHATDLSPLDEQSITLSRDPDVPLHQAPKSEEHYDLTKEHYDITMEHNHMSINNYRMSIGDTLIHTQKAPLCSSTPFVEREYPVLDLGSNRVQTYEKDTKSDSGRASSPASGELGGTRGEKEMKEMMQSLSTDLEVYMSGQRSQGAGEVRNDTVGSMGTELTQHAITELSEQTLMEASTRPTDPFYQLIALNPTSSSDHLSIGSAKGYSEPDNSSSKSMSQTSLEHILIGAQNNEKYPNSESPSSSHNSRSLSQTGSFNVLKPSTSLDRLSVGSQGNESLKSVAISRSSLPIEKEEQHFQTPALKPARSLDHLSFDSRGSAEPLSHINASIEKRDSSLLKPAISLDKLSVGSQGNKDGASNTNSTSSKGRGSFQIIPPKYSASFERLSGSKKNSVVSDKSEECCLEFSGKGDTSAISATNSYTMSNAASTLPSHEASVNNSNNQMRYGGGLSKEEEDSLSQRVAALLAASTANMSMESLDVTPGVSREIIDSEVGGRESAKESDNEDIDRITSEYKSLLKEHGEELDPTGFSTSESEGTVQLQEFHKAKGRTLRESTGEKSSIPFESFETENVILEGGREYNPRGHNQGRTNTGRSNYTNSGHNTSGSDTEDALDKDVKRILAKYGRSLSDSESEDPPRRRRSSPTGSTQSNDEMSTRVRHLLLDKDGSTSSIGESTDKLQAGGKLPTYLYDDPAKSMSLPQLGDTMASSDLSPAPTGEEDEDVGPVDKAEENKEQVQESNQQALVPQQQESEDELGSRIKDMLVKTSHLPYGQPKFTQDNGSGSVSKRSSLASSLDFGTLEKDLDEIRINLDSIKSDSRRSSAAGSMKSLPTDRSDGSVVIDASKITITSGASDFGTPRKYNWDHGADLADSKGLFISKQDVSPESQKSFGAQKSARSQRLFEGQNLSKDQVLDPKKKSLGDLGVDPLLTSGVIPMDIALEIVHDRHYSSAGRPQYVPDDSITSQPADVSLVKTVKDSSLMSESASNMKQDDSQRRLKHQGKLDNSEIEDVIERSRPRSRTNHVDSEVEDVLERSKTKPHDLSNQSFSERVQEILERGSPPRQAYRYLEEADRQKEFLERSYKEHEESFREFQKALEANIRSSRANIELADNEYIVPADVKTEGFDISQVSDLAYNLEISPLHPMTPLNTLKNMQSMFSQQLTKAATYTFDQSLEWNSPKRRYMGPDAKTRNTNESLDTINSSQSEDNIGQSVSQVRSDPNLNRNSSVQRDEASVKSGSGSFDLEYEIRKRIIEDQQRKLQEEILREREKSQLEAEERQRYYKDLAGSPTEHRIREALLRKDNGQRESIREKRTRDIEAKRVQSPTGTSPQDSIPTDNLPSDEHLVERKVARQSEINRQGPRTPSPVDKILSGPSSLNRQVPRNPSPVEGLLTDPSPVNRHVPKNSSPVDKVLSGSVRLPKGLSPIDRFLRTASAGANRSRSLSPSEGASFASSHPVDHRDQTSRSRDQSTRSTDQSTRSVDQSEQSVDQDRRSADQGDRSRDQSGRSSRGQREGSFSPSQNELAQFEHERQQKEKDSYIEKNLPGGHPRSRELTRQSSSSRESSLTPPSARGRPLTQGINDTTASSRLRSPHLIPYKPPGSQDVYYIESGTEDGNVSVTALSETTVESTHPGSDDAHGPHFPPHVLGSRAEGPRDAVGVYGNKQRAPSPVTLGTIPEQPSFVESKEDSGGHSKSEESEKSRRSEDKERSFKKTKSWVKGNFNGDPVDLHLDTVEVESVKSVSEQGPVEDQLSSARTEDLEKERDYGREFSTPSKRTEKKDTNIETKGNKEPRWASFKDLERPAESDSLLDKRPSSETMIRSSMTGSTTAFSNTYNDVTSSQALSRSQTMESKIRKQREEIMRKYGYNDKDMTLRADLEDSREKSLSKSPLRDEGVGRNPDFVRSRQDRVSPATVFNHRFQPLRSERSSAIGTKDSFQPVMSERDNESPERHSSLVPDDRAFMDRSADTVNTDDLLTEMALKNSMYASPGGREQSLVGQDTEYRDTGLPYDQQVQNMFQQYERDKEDYMKTNKMSDSWSPYAKGPSVGSISGSPPTAKISPAVSPPRSKPLNPPRSRSLTPPRSRLAPESRSPGGSTGRISPTRRDDSNVVECSPDIIRHSPARDMFRSLDSSSTDLIREHRDREYERLIQRARLVSGHQSPELHLPPNANAVWEKLQQRRLDEKDRKYERITGNDQESASDQKDSMGKQAYGGSDRERSQEGLQESVDERPRSSGYGPTLDSSNFAPLDRLRGIDSGDRQKGRFGKNPPQVYRSEKSDQSRNRRSALSSDKSNDTTLPETSADLSSMSTTSEEPTPRPKKLAWVIKDETLPSVPEDSTLDSVTSDFTTSSEIDSDGKLVTRTTKKHLPDDPKLLRLQRKIAQQKEKYRHERLRETKRKEKISKMERLLKEKGKALRRSQEEADPRFLDRKSEMSSSTPSKQSSLLSSESTTLTLSEMTDSSTLTDDTYNVHEQSASSPSRVSASPNVYQDPGYDYYDYRAKIRKEIPTTKKADQYRKDAAPLSLKLQKVEYNRQELNTRHKDYEIEKPKRKTSPSKARKSLQLSPSRKNKENQEMRKKSKEASNLKQKEKMIVIKDGDNVDVYLKKPEKKDFGATCPTPASTSPPSKKKYVEVSLISEGVQTSPMRDDIGVISIPSMSQSPTRRKSPGRQGSPKELRSPVQRSRSTQYSITQDSSMFIPEADMKRKKKVKVQKVKKAPGVAWFIPVGNQKPWRQPLQDRQQYAKDLLSRSKLTAWTLGIEAGQKNNGEMEADIYMNRSRSAVLDGLDLSGVNELPKEKDSLQEAFQSKMGSFISRSRERQRHVALRGEERRMQELHRLQRAHLFNVGRSHRHANPQAHPLSDQHFKPKRRFMTKQEMKEMSKKAYKKLPEVVKAAEEKKRQEEYKTNRLRAKLYQKRIQNIVLRKQGGWLQT